MCRVGSESEEELFRLSELLRAIDEGLDDDTPQREALVKAGLALCLVFNRGLRSEIEQQYEQLGKPLTELQREHLRSMGIDPEE